MHSRNKSIIYIQSHYPKQKLKKSHQTHQHIHNMSPRITKYTTTITNELKNKHQTCLFGRFRTLTIKLSQTHDMIFYPTLKLRKYMFIIKKFEQCDGSRTWLLLLLFANISVTVKCRKPAASCLIIRDDESTHEQIMRWLHLNV